MKISLLILLCSVLGCGAAGTLSGKGSFGFPDCPGITAQPTSATQLTNVATSFTVAGTGGALVYQWRSNSVNIANGIDFSGATTATLTASNRYAQTNSLTCVLTNFCGSVTSSVATQSVTNGAGGGGNGLLNALAAVWEMEAAANANQPDATGNGHTFTLNSGSTAQNSTHIEGSFAVSSVNGTFANSDSVFKSTSSFSVSTWVNANGASHGGEEFFDRRSVQDIWQLVLDGSSKPIFYVRNAADNAWTTVTSTHTFNGSSWHLIVIIWDSVATTASISMDDETFVTSAAVSGGINGPGSSFLNFQITSYIADETLYWTTALTKAQVDALWANGSGLFYSSGGFTN